ncbi:hypothetical protein BCY84_19682 [Trypanosoma cruzi cruzi]|uniref:Transmembrane protein n=2 Tax=Trypanosoma cruzi TaxID=5693 RepID=A0A2V2URW1_TRYCR|nr:hypothetical protein BCY84_19682 [Trypanosoma cruzi cruzi]PWU86771.1 hypothetical protein C4B63_111g23 [Trypanosoma cruzi]
MLSRSVVVKPLRLIYSSFLNPSCGASYICCYRMMSADNCTSVDGQTDGKKASSFASSFSIDPKKLPNTIPGVSREELAERLERYQRELSYKAAQASARELADEIETMRRALPPEQFRQFLQDVDAMAEKNEKEIARLSAMSPQQLYRYHQRQRRRMRLQAIWKSVVLLVSIFGAVFFLFFLMFFFG